MTSLLPPVVAELMAENKDFMAKMAESKAAMDDMSKHGSSSFSKLSSVGGAILAGVGGALVATGAMAVHMSDQFDTAQASLKTAIDDSGHHFGDFKDQVARAQDKMQGLGFDMAQTDQALATLTTSTQNPKESIKLLGEAADLARFKHISLADASQMLARVMAGSNRAVMQLGLNLDLGSGKMSTLRTAHEALITSEIHLQQVQQGVNDGTLKGVAGQNALENATRAVSLAQQKYSLDSQTVQKTLDAINQRTHDAAQNFGKTLPGQLQVTEAEAKNLLTVLGEDLTPVLEHLLADVKEGVVWLGHHKDALYALAAVAGGIASIAIGAFVINTGQKFVSAVQSAITSVSNLATSLTGAATTTDTAGTDISTSMSSAATAVEGDATQMEASFEGIGASADAAAVQVEALNAAGVGGGNISRSVTTTESTVMSGSTAATGEGSLVAGGAGKGGLLALAGPIAALTVALGALGQIMHEGLKGYADHKPTIKDIAHPSQWPADAADAIYNGMRQGMRLSNDLFNPNSGVPRNELGQLVPGGHAPSGTVSGFMATLTAQVAKDKTVSSKFDALFASSKAQSQYLATMEAFEKKLSTEGTMKESRQELANLKNQLATERTLGLSHSVQMQTLSHIQSVEDHISQLKATAADITKTKDTLSQTDKLGTHLGDILTETKGQHSDLKTGITVTKLPDKTVKATGTVRLSVG